MCFPTLTLYLIVIRSISDIFSDLIYQTLRLDHRYMKRILKHPLLHGILVDGYPHRHFIFGLIQKLHLFAKPVKEICQQIFLCTECHRYALTGKDTLSYSSIKKIYLFWSAMIKHAKNMGELPNNYSIMNSVIMPAENSLPVETKEIEIIDEKDIPIIEEIAMMPSPNRNERFLYRYGPAIVFLLNTGLRGGELLALGKSKIIWKDSRRYVKINKTLSRVKNRDKNAKTKTKLVLTDPKYPNSVRIVPLNKKADFCLQCMLELYDTNYFEKDLILATQNHISPTLQNIRNTLVKICRRAGIQEYSLHALRHTFATNIVRKTTNMGELKDAAELLGDSYDVVIKTYFHTDSQKKVDLVDAIA